MEYWFCAKGKEDKICEFNNFSNVHGNLHVYSATSVLFCQNF